MKSTPDNIDHRIQIKLDQITRYKYIIRNYPPTRMASCGIPYLERLQNELDKLYTEKAQ